MTTRTARRATRTAFTEDIVLYPLGDHWVAYDRDATILATLLDLPICHRNAAPYAGFPACMLNQHCDTIERMGYTVKVICKEQ